MENENIPDPKVKLFQIKVPPDLHAQAKAKAKREGVPIAVVIRAMMKQWVDDRLKIKVAKEAA